MNLYVFFIKKEGNISIFKTLFSVEMAHPASSPEARAVVDDQGQTLNCTLHAVSKAVTEGIH